MTDTASSLVIIFVTLCLWVLTEKSEAGRAFGVLAIVILVVVLCGLLVQQIPQVSLPNMPPQDLARYYAPTCGGDVWKVEKRKEWRT
jgi:hypothetical protein